MKTKLLSEIRYQFSRSSGPGGQHVNKTESKVELHWNLEESTSVSEEQKQVLRRRLAKRLNAEGELVMYSQKTRSQVKNREDVTERFLALIERLLQPPKVRKKTRPTRAAKEKRLKDKKALSEKKRRRNTGDLDP